MTTVFGLRYVSGMSVRHLAKLAGLSPSAVSLALHDSPKVSVETRRRVRELAERAGYRPSAKVAELMAQVRARRETRAEECLGVISLYAQPRPWERTEHLQLIHASMTRRAAELGYRLEPLWLRAPGMTPRRFRAVLEARGVRGLLCFGGPVLDEPFPRELDRCAVVTIGLSIDAPLHRITSHAFRDTTRALERVRQLGYRRPGLVLAHCEELRSGRAHLGAYLGWYDSVWPDVKPVPALRLDDDVGVEPLASWLGLHEPDVLIFVHHDLDGLAAALRRLKIATPARIGVVALTHFIEGTGFTGLQQNQQQMGAAAVELLVTRLLQNEFGLPAEPHTEMVESCWVNGRTLRRQARAKTISRASADAG